MSGRKVTGGGRRRWATVSLLCAIALTSPVVGRPSPAAAQEASTVDYDLPSLPLSEALIRFGRLAGFHVNYDERLAEGLVSRPVGRAGSPQEALDKLLEGTGLVPRFTRKDAFTVVPRPAEGQPDMRLDDLIITAPIIGRPSSEDYVWYGSLLLEECFRKLRGQTTLRGRKYDLQLYVWLDSAGSVTRLETVGPPDQDDVRQTIEAALSGLRLASLPPQAMPQPIRLRISAM